MLLFAESWYGWCECRGVKGSCGTELLMPGDKVFVLSAVCLQCMAECMAVSKRPDSYLVMGVCAR